MVSERVTFRIEHGVPMPKCGSIKRKYPFPQMNVRDSFFVPCEFFEVKNLMFSLTSCMRWASVKTGFKFAQRAVEGGIRVWRIQ